MIIAINLARKIGDRALTGTRNFFLFRRYRKREGQWVFSHRYWSRKEDGWKVGLYVQRQLMNRLCRKAGVRPFGFHALRHAGASLLDNSNVPIGSIQRILGHENRTTTEIYLHSIGESERLAMDIFERSREQSHTDGKRVSAKS